MYIDAIEENIAANRKGIRGTIGSRAIDWTEDTPEDLIETADCVLICDCIYYQDSLEPLINTFSNLLKRQKDATVILAYERRKDKEDLYSEFFQITRKTYNCEEILTSVLDNKNTVFLIKLSKK